MTRLSRGGADKPKTVAAVVAYADVLRRRAMRVLAPDSTEYDPYAKPYYPTTAAARKLCERATREETAKLGPNPTDDQLTAARAAGAQAALEEMAWRAGRADTKRQEEERNTTEARHRLAARHRRATRDREVQLGALTPGQRIDRALAALATVSAAPGTGFDTRISGTQDYLVIGHGDPTEKAKAIARDAVRGVEAELEAARRRLVEAEEAA